MTGPTPTVRVIGMDELPLIESLNSAIFEEKRIINTFDRDDLLMLVAELDGRPIAFKVGYRENRFVFYSAKGGVLDAFRRKGIASVLLDAMLAHAREGGYRRFSFDTFPNRHPGMTVLALQRGYRVVQADYNPTYRDFRLRFETRI